VFANFSFCRRGCRAFFSPISSGGWVRPSFMLGEGIGLFLLFCFRISHLIEEGFAPWFSDADVGALQGVSSGYVALPGAGVGAFPVGGGRVSLLQFGGFRLLSRVVNDFSHVLFPPLPFCCVMVVWSISVVRASILCSFTFCLCCGAQSVTRVFLSLSPQFVQAPPSCPFFVSVVVKGSCVFSAHCRHVLHDCGINSSWW